MLEKLEFMIALSREQHFGRAAESCGVAQPTLSLGIQSLEQMLNTPLVKRRRAFKVSRRKASASWYGPTGWSAMRARCGRTFWV